MRVALISSRYPFPPWRGNQVRTVEWIEALSQHRLDIICPRPDGEALRDVAAGFHHYPLGLVSRAGSLLRAAVAGRPLQEGLFESGPARRFVSDIIRASSPDVVIVQMVRCAWAGEAVEETNPSIPIVFDAIDAMGLHFERAAMNAAAPLAVAYRAEAARCRRRERAVVEKAQISVAVSQRDLEALEAPADKGRVISVAGREVQATSVEDTAPIVLLSGNLGYRPTVQGAEWFAREVWSEVRKRVPAALWIMAGARPAPAIRRLGDLPGVEVHADVPDLGEYLGSARVAIAPMSSGSGVPMKVLEAMAAGVPAVVHPWAADGLADGSDDAVAVASRAKDWVDILADLLGDAGAARDLGERGRDLWRQHYHPDVVAGKIRQVVYDAADSAC
jgi:glycosyltransferase involved in cell wall biosynthesis